MRWPGRRRTDEAIEHYSKATELDPDFVEAHANLAVVLTREGRLVEAVKRFETAASLRPDSVELQRHLRRSLDRAAAARPSPGRDEADQPRPAPPSPPA